MKSRMSEIGRDAQGATRSQSRKQESQEAVNNICEDKLVR